MPTLHRQTQLARTTTAKLLIKTRKAYLKSRELDDAIEQEIQELNYEIHNKDDETIKLTKTGLRRLRQSHDMLWKSFMDMKDALIARGEWSWLDYVRDE